MHIPFFNFSGGGNASISPFLIDQTQMPDANGINISYSLGAILKDLGFSIVDDTLPSGKPALGLFNFIQDTATQKELATSNNSIDTATELFYKTDSGSWTNIPTAAWTVADQRVFMESFIGYTFFVGADDGVVFLPVGSLTDTTFSTSDQVTNMPQARFIQRYRDRIYIANCKDSGTLYPFRVFFSSVPTAGTLSWTPATDFIDVDFSDAITGLASNFDRLIIFTQFKTYFYDQFQFKQVFDVGSQNQDVVQSHSVYTIFTNRTGVWITTGGQPQNISGNIIDFIRNSDPTVWRSAMVDEEYCLYLGDVTVNGRDYQNLVQFYDFQTNTWRWRELSKPMGKFSRYMSLNTDEPGMRLYMADLDGNVWNKSKYADVTIVSEDEQTTGPGTGKPIAVNFELAPMNLGDYSLDKNVNNLIAFANRAQGLNLQIRVLDRNARALTPYKPLGQLTGYVNNFQVNAPKGAIIQIAGSEVSRNPYFSFYGFDVSVTKDKDTLHTK